MRIKSLMFQNAVGIPGTKLANEFTINEDKFPGIKMTLISAGVLLSIPRVDGVTLSALVPLANVRYMVVDAQEGETIVGKSARIAN